MPTRLERLVVDAADPPALAQFWSEATRWSRRAARWRRLGPLRQGPLLEFIRVDEPQSGSGDALLRPRPLGPFSA